MSQLDQQAKNLNKACFKAQTGEIHVCQPSGENQDKTSQQTGQDDTLDAGVGVKGSITA